MVFCKVINSIKYVFPATQKSKKFFALLTKLFGRLCFSSPSVFPRTIFAINGNADKVQLWLDDEKFCDLYSNKSVENPVKLPMDVVAEKLAGHIKQIDHTGIGLPLLDEKTWGNYVNRLAARGNLYTYPTGEPWYFLIPATRQENKNDICDFNLVRGPKFELVNDEDTATIQIDMETDLTKSEVEKLFPKDQGVYFDTLADVFKAIYIDFDEHLDIRFDLRFKQPRGDWESGKWLVQNGRRILDLFPQIC
jgi:hypothetical protein